MIPRAYGVTNLWLEQTPPARSMLPANQHGYAAGASPTIYFANPTIPAVQTPLDLNAPNATYCSPFDKKHVIIDRATGMGTLVVTSVFINAFVVTDTGAQYDPMMGTGGFNNLYVFSYGRPPAAIVPGRVMAQVSGNVSKFVGFTELNFPLQTYTDRVDPMLVPPCVLLDVAKDPGLPGKLMRLTGAAVCAKNVRVCPIDPEMDDWRKYNQFNVNTNGNCDPFSSFAVSLPGKTLGAFDPLKLDPLKATIDVTGMLRNFSGQNEADPHTECTDDTPCQAIASSDHCVDGVCKKGAYNFWLITPRDESDITVH
jgi:hypothetical protein